MQSKREFRQRRAARPIEEKLAMLHELRARAIALRNSRPEERALSLALSDSLYPGLTYGVPTGH
jgi:hypothetical protein